MKAKLRVQEISKALKLFLIESGEVKQKRRKEDDYDYENDADIVHITSPDEDTRFVITSPKAKSKMFRIQVEQASKSLLDDLSDSDSSDVEVQFRPDSSCSLVSQSSEKLSSPSTASPANGETLSVRERTLLKVRRHRLREESLSKIEPETKKHPNIEMEPGAILERDRFRKKSIESEIMLEQHIKSLKETDNNLIFTSDDEYDSSM